MPPAKTTQPTEQPKPSVGIDATQADADELTRLRAENARLKAERDQEQAPPALRKVEPTHVLVLANGDTVETASPVATHHSDDDGTVWPVVNRFELPRREE